MTPAKGAEGSPKGGSKEVLVIKDESGNLYLIARDLLEKGKVVDRARADAWITNPEVSGFAMGSSYQVVKSIRVPSPTTPTKTLRDSLRNL